MPSLPPDPIQFRAFLAQRETELVNSLPPLPPDLTEEHLTIPSAPPKQLLVTRPTVLPSGSNSNSNSNSNTHTHTHTPTPTPLILLFHGGGFIGGTPSQLTRPAREFASAFRAVVISAPYALIPEHPFPGSIEDAYDTLLWVARHASAHFPSINLTKSEFIVGGMSAGANLAAVLAPLSLSRGELPPNVKITGSFLTIPSLLVPAILPAEYTKDWTSREANAHGDPALPGSLTTSRVDAILGLLNPDTHSALFSPFNAPEDVLQRLPRTYIQVGGLDCLRDDGVVYEKFLKARGVEVKLDVYPNLGHVAYSVFTQDGDEQEKELREKTMEAMKWLLRLE